MAKETKSILRDLAEIIIALTVFGVLLWLFLSFVTGVFGAAKLEWGVGRATTCLGAAEREEEYESAEEETEALRRYVEGEGEAPAWYKPDEEMAVEWVSEELGVGSEEVNTTPDSSFLTPVCTDIGCPDYNVETVLYGWDGHSMESWEMDLFARIVYLEFNGTEPECMNAGIDSILNLWESGYFGRTIFETLSATAENGALVYTTYGYVWDWDYDYTVLQEIKTLCAERFMNGPRYGCHFFQLYGFPWWAQPLYEIDQVYFSTFKEERR